jgi:hypothetical protein
MIFNDNIGVTGDVSIVVTDRAGVEKTRIQIPNLVVTTGKNHIAARMAGALLGAGLEGALISHIGFGTSVITPTILNTALGSQLASRSVVVLSHTAATNTFTATATFTGTAGIITEAGMFNALTGGVMICRTVFGAVNILSTDALAIAWTLTIN